MLVKHDLFWHWKDFWLKDILQVSPHSRVEECGGKVRILILPCFCGIDRTKDAYCDLPSPPLPFGIEGPFWKGILTPLEVECLLSLRRSSWYFCFTLNVEQQPSQKLWKKSLIYGKFVFRSTICLSFSSKIPQGGQEVQCYLE